MALETSVTTKKSPKLPTQVASPVEVGRLLRELDSLDDTLVQLKLRTGGKAVTVPKTTHLMDQLLELNKLNLLHESDRQFLKDFLTLVKSKAPVLHISFSADPSVAFTEKLMTWLRREIHPQLLLSIGLQPNIGAGCMVRSTNKYFDFTLRQKFNANRQLLLEKLGSHEAKA